MPSQTSLIGLFLLSLLGAGWADQVLAVEFLQNPDFEDEIKKPNWYGAGCKVETSSASFTGLSSAVVTEREDINSFLRQDLTLATGVRYFFSAHVRLMNEMNEKGHQIEMYVGYKIGTLFYEMLLS
ncbi:hypothetical protein CAPTEDRAFT_214236 [Capitella teleta]|uniref:CBM-cenC domain-containing protein n=1 Tax=Capitella teleta TaxID=283909 RepID=R7UC43_CAPTE|nr:hypothetical protein CAPTEDRAFT_214236 [Capitella teleta]|eukprot:ELU01363.1 hypothetical protein CAPTEDRAFT_214236 [Capitella teleta]